MPARLRVSVVIPTFNRASLVGRAVTSALSAVIPGDEVIVVDDGSTDDTAGALAPFGERIRFIRAPHGGAGATRNRGVAETRGDLVAFLDSDDEWSADHLLLHRSVHAAQERIALSFADFSLLDRKGIVHRRYLAQWHGDPRPWSVILGPAVPYSEISSLPVGRADFPVHTGNLYAPQMERDYIPTFTLVAKRPALPDSKWFAEDVPTFEDMQCFGRLTGVGPAAFLDAETAVQHGHAAPRLTDVPDVGKSETRLKILDRIWGSDPAFLAAHGDAYRERVRGQHILRARCLLKAGRRAEGREALRVAGHAPLSYRMFSLLPGPVARGVTKTIGLVR